MCSVGCLAASGHAASLRLLSSLPVRQNRQNARKHHIHSADTVVGMTSSSSSASSPSLCVNLVCAAASTGGSWSCRNHDAEKLLQQTRVIDQAMSVQPLSQSTCDSDITRIRTTSIYVVGYEGGASAVNHKINAFFIIKLPKREKRVCCFILQVNPAVPAVLTLPDTGTRLDAACLHVVVRHPSKCSVTRQPAELPMCPGVSC